MKEFILKYSRKGNMKPLTGIILMLLTGIFPLSAFAQKYLRAEGKRIVDGNGNNFILRGIGTGNWMIQEGYMMQSSDFADTQHEFRAKLEQSIGSERTKEFYDSWLANHFRKSDADSMAAWGFNCVRVALHYKWFTPPIEDEPVQGKVTWLDKGFEMIDSLLEWCGQNQMYLILDLHGAPGGQGYNASISDYDPSKPSLWESELNKAKTVALWKKLAERYADNPWIGGYDLINEVNWTFAEGNNASLRNLYIRITNAIREVDKNHIIFIEGNGFANDFTGLTPAWDNNMVYSFHKYWSYNNENSLDWVLNLREQTNCPLWLGETGENSNTWFTNLVALAEKNNIGWSWWPVKKAGINNVLEVVTNDDYRQLMETWSRGGTVSDEEVYNAVMQYSLDHRTENCLVNYDVIDALIRQPYTAETKPFKSHVTGQEIFAVDYDLGRNNYAYYDLDTCNFHLEENNFTDWNKGWTYRNDGVDIQNTSDTAKNNGFHAGWIEDGEWLQYTIVSEQEGAYSFQIRTASEQEGMIRIETDGKIASEPVVLAATGGWDRWRTTTADNIILPEGEVKVRIFFMKGHINFNWFSLTSPRAVSSVSFKLLSAETDQLENRIYLNLNKPVTSLPGDLKVNDFQIIKNNALTDIAGIHISENNNHQLVIDAVEDFFSGDKIRISYKGNSVYSNMQNLETFTGAGVDNKVYEDTKIPGFVEAEDFMFNNGFRAEACEEGGLNMGYADNGDYLDYLINVSETGTYSINFRVAALSGTPEILLMLSEGNRMVPVKSVKFQSTGGWQSWDTQTASVELLKGKQVLRIYSRSGEHNLNWISFDLITKVNNLSSRKIEVYPNPASGILHIQFQDSGQKQLALYNMTGDQVMRQVTVQSDIQINTDRFAPGSYLLNVRSKDMKESIKIIIGR